MIALTARLNERDETIIQLQEELDAYDRVNKESEEVSERRRARVKRICPHRTRASRYMMRRR